MDTKKFLKAILGTHATMSFVELFMYVLLSGIFRDNTIFQWTVFVFLVALYWFMIYLEASKIGENNLKRGSFKRTRGFIVGLYATIPALILYIAALIYRPLKFLLHIWLSPYIRLFVSFEDAMPHLAILTALLLPIVTGVSYIDGIRRRNKLLKAIEEKRSKKEDLSKMDS